MKGSISNFSAPCMAHFLSPPLSVLALRQPMDIQYRQHNEVNGELPEITCQGDHLSAEDTSKPNHHSYSMQFLFIPSMLFFLP